MGEFNNLYETWEEAERILEHYREVATDPQAVLEGGEIFQPVKTLEDMYGGRAQIGVDDGCYVLYLMNEQGIYRAVSHLFPEAFHAIKDLPPVNELFGNGKKKKKSEFEMVRDALAKASYGKDFVDLSHEQQKRIIKNMKRRGFRQDRSSFESVDCKKFSDLIESGKATIELSYLRGKNKMTWSQTATAIYQILETVEVPENSKKHVERFCNEARSTFLDWAEDEVKRAGLCDEDADYDGELGKAVMELISVFDAQGHSGYSAGMVRSIFDNLASWKPLTPLTSNPDEWTEVTEGMWQSKRNPACFSDDGGKTYTDQNDPCWSHVDEYGLTYWSRPENEEDITIHESEPYE